MLTHKLELTSNELKIIAEIISCNNIYLYRGYIYDVETNLFLVSSRYYSPELCRWISPDDIEYLDPESVNGLNLYCYCLNNPIMYIDPDGHVAFWILALVGIVVGGAVTGVINVMTKSENDSTMGAFIGGFFEGVVSGAALALGLAIGTMSGGIGYMLLGGAIALVGGFIGGKYGNAITQQISYGNVDWAISNVNGIRSGVMNLYSYICFGMNKDILSNSNRLINRFVDNLYPSTFSVAISSYIGLLPKIFSNNNRDKERIESQDGRFIWDYLF